MPGQTWDSFDMTRPDWVVDELNAHSLLPAGTQANIAEFNYADSQLLTLAAGAVTAGAGETLTLTAPLKHDILAGQILDFGDGELFTLEQRANRGDTELVGTLAADVEGGETYTYPGMSGRTVIRSGEFVGRTFVERNAGTGFGVADAANDDELYLVAFQNEYAEQDAGITLLRHNCVIYENKLPGWAGYNSATQAKIRELYQCITYPA
ncbi:MAG: hypothetical protein AAGI45_13470 [Cyanobacteria bacterium P01_H01_bin.26]